jgi:hypothetical protein
MNENDPAMINVIQEGLRPLKWNEMVRRGDFVEDGRKGFEPWVGPGGFRADAFVKQIYRRLGRQPGETKKQL